MLLKNPRSRLHIPDGESSEQALQRCTRIGIGAHQDDLEIMAFHGILQCFNSDSEWFCGVTCTNGSGGPRKPGLESLSEREISQLRNKEQNAAADMGQYGAMIQLNIQSADVKGSDKRLVVDEIARIFEEVQPAVVYTHNPADKHSTHVAVLVAVVQAIRELPVRRKPDKLYGCEVWRDLDWLDDDEKVRLDVSGNDELALGLINCHASQVTTAKRYDLASIGRRRANATYSDSHSNAAEEYVTYAMDLSPLIHSDDMDLTEFVAQKISNFERIVLSNLGTLVTE